MRNANAPLRQQGFIPRQAEPGAVPGRYRAEVAKALEDLSAIMAGLDTAHCLPTDVPAAIIPRRLNHVRR